MAHGRARIVQLHPTLRCNLTCRHCYSSSGPRRHQSLPHDKLSATLADARQEDYEVVSISGGEPLLYRDLVPLLAHARALGLTTTVTTNGTLLTERRLSGLAEHLGLLAISLDGVPASHDRMRGEGAFARLERRLPAVRGSGIPFGFIFTLTQHNLNELTWVLEFCLEEGARLLQIHPLEAVGRAKQELPSAIPDAQEAAFAWLRALELQSKAGASLRVQLDLVDYRYIRERPERVFAGEQSDASQAPLGELLSPLVVETDGTVAPLEYGFDRSLALGNIHTEPLGEMARRWREDGYERFRMHCRRAIDSLGGERELPLVNWFDVVSGRDAEARAETLPLG